MDVGMIYKAHKQEGTIAATTLVIKRALAGTSSQESLYANQFKVKQSEKNAWLLDMQCSH